MLQVQPILICYSLYRQTKALAYQSQTEHGQLYGALWKKKGPKCICQDYFITTAIGDEYRRNCVRCEATYSINSISTLRAHARKHGFLIESDTQKRFMMNDSWNNTVQLSKREIKERLTKQLCRYGMDYQLQLATLMC